MYGGRARLRGLFGCGVRSLVVFRSRPEKPRPAGAAYAILFLLGAGKNRRQTASSKPREQHGRTTYFPVPEPAGDTPPEGIAAAPHRTAQTNPIRASAALTRLYEYNITLRYTFINLV